MGAGASRVESSRACDASVAVAMRARMGMPFVRGMKVWLRRGHTRTSPVRRYQYRIGVHNAVPCPTTTTTTTTVVVVEEKVDWRAVCEIKTEKKHEHGQKTQPKIDVPSADKHISPPRSIPSHQIPPHPAPPPTSPNRPSPLSFPARPPRLPTLVLHRPRLPTRPSHDPRTPRPTCDIHVPAPRFHPRLALRSPRPPGTRPRHAPPPAPTLFPRQPPAASPQTARSRFPPSSPAPGVSRPFLISLGSRSATFRQRRPCARALPLARFCC